MKLDSFIFYMLGRNLFVISGLIVIFLSALVGYADAATVPTFPLCANPQGQVIASYDSGVHGVAGDSATYGGKDTVYSLGEGTLVQCLCPTSGSGVQTNWWKISELSQDEINVLISQGWIYVPNGAAWGLDSAPYLAKNTNFSCSSGNSGGTGDGLSDGKSDGKSSGGSILATSTQAVLSLASTGNKVFIYTVFLSGLVLLLTGFVLSFKKRG